MPVHGGECPGGCRTGRLHSFGPGFCCPGRSPCRTSPPSWARFGCPWGAWEACGDEAGRVLDVFIRSRSVSVRVVRLQRVGCRRRAKRGCRVALGGVSGDRLIARVVSCRSCGWCRGRECCTPGPVGALAKTLVSRDGLRAYRPPTFKPRLGKTQANFERWDPGQVNRTPIGNGHLDIN